MANLFTLRKNSPQSDTQEYKDLVERWQFFLRGQEYPVVADGDFGAITERHTQEFQSEYNLLADGIVGSKSWGKAFELGFRDLSDEDDSSDPRQHDQRSRFFPPHPTELNQPDSGARRDGFFGHLAFRHTPTARNREHITITNSFENDNIMKVIIPQLVGVNGASHDGEVRFHKTVAVPVTKLFKAWEDAGLDHLILTWAGSYYPRLKRGKSSSESKDLSNHAYGSAFDINAKWNWLGDEPAQVGKHGSIRELVPLANEHGFFWGGHYRTRPDGMHFEFADF